jgi:hypothetical protein
MSGAKRPRSGTILKAAGNCTALIATNCGRGVSYLGGTLTSTGQQDIPLPPVGRCSPGFAGAWWLACGQFSIPAIKSIPPGSAADGSASGMCAADCCAAGMRAVPPLASAGSMQPVKHATAAIHSESTAAVAVRKLRNVNLILSSLYPWFPATQFISRRPPKAIPTPQRNPHASPSTRSRQGSPNRYRAPRQEHSEPHSQPNAFLATASTLSSFRRPQNNASTPPPEDQRRRRIRPAPRGAAFAPAPYREAPPVRP